MGPDDYMRMYFGWKMDRELQVDDQERLLYLIRHLTTTVHNTVSKQKIKDPARQLMKLKSDPDPKSPERKARLKKKSDDLFRKAKNRGRINE